MPKLIKGKVCAITFAERGTADADAGDNCQTIIGTFTGEIDTWGKYTIALLDNEADGPYYLFADEVLAVEVCSEVEVEAETEGILQGRCEHAVRLLREADRLLQSVEVASRYHRASQVARSSLIVQRAIVAVEEVR